MVLNGNCQFNPSCININFILILVVGSRRAMDMPYLLLTYLSKIKFKVLVGIFLGLDFEVMCVKCFFLTMIFVRR